MRALEESEEKHSELEAQMHEAIEVRICVCLCRSSLFVCVSIILLSLILSASGY